MSNNHDTAIMVPSVLDRSLQNEVFTTADIFDIQRMSLKQYILDSHNSLPDVSSSIVIRFEVPEYILEEIYPKDEEQTARAKFNEYFQEILNEAQKSLNENIITTKKRLLSDPKVEEPKYLSEPYNIFDPECDLPEIPRYEEYYNYVKEKLYDIFAIDKMAEDRLKKVDAWISKYLNEFKTLIMSNTNYQVKEFTKIFLMTFPLFLGEIIHHFTELKISFYVDPMRYLNLEIHCPNENLFVKLAEKHSYPLQLKITSDQEILEGRVVSVSHAPMNSVSQRNQIQFEDLDSDDISHFPPHLKFTQSRINHFRRYSRNDQHHYCGLGTDLQGGDSENVALLGNSCGQCTLFRTIDMLRLIQSEVESLINLNGLKSNKFVKGIIIIRNNIQLEEEFEQKDHISGFYNLVETKKMKQTHQFIRNFLGEKVGFYFIFTSHYITWLIYPAVIGIFIYLCTFVLSVFIDLSNSQDIAQKIQPNVDTTGYSVHLVPQSKALGSIRTLMNLFYTMLIILWGCLYTGSLSCTQKFYSYIWGMTESNEVSRECSKTRCRKCTRFQGVRIPIKSSFKIFYKHAYASLISFLMMGISILINLILIAISEYHVYGYGSNATIIGKLKNTIIPEQGERKNQVQSSFWYYFIPILSVVIRTILSKINYMVVERLCKYEEHVLEEQYENSYIVKVTVFEFVNYYFYLIFIAYFKRYQGMCAHNDCFGELGQQLIVILCTSSILNIIQILVPFGKKLARTHQAPEEIRNLLDHRITSLLRDQYKDSIAFEYLEIVFNYGYVILFGIASPVCFVVAMIHVYIARMVGLFKLVKLYSSAYIEGSQGSGIILKILKIFTFVGIITNCTIIYFTMDLTVNRARWASIFVIENIIVFLYLTIKYDSLPSWFPYLDQIKHNIITKLSTEKG